MSRDTVFQEIRPGGAGLKTGDFVEEKFGGEGYRRTTLPHNMIQLDHRFGYRQNIKTRGKRKSLPLVI